MSTNKRLLQTDINSYIQIIFISDTHSKESRSLKSQVFSKYAKKLQIFMKCGILCLPDCVKENVQKDS